MRTNLLFHRQLRGRRPSRQFRSARKVSSKPSTEPTPPSSARQPPQTPLPSHRATISPRSHRAPAAVSPCGRLAARGTAARGRLAMRPSRRARHCSARPSRHAAVSPPRAQPSRAKTRHSLSPCSRCAAVSPRGWPFRRADVSPSCRPAAARQSRRVNLARDLPRMLSRPCWSSPRLDFLRLCRLCRPIDPSHRSL